MADPVRTRFVTDESSAGFRALDSSLTNRVPRNSGTRFVTDASSALNPVPSPQGGLLFRVSEGVLQRPFGLDKYYVGHLLFELFPVHVLPSAVARPACLVLAWSPLERVSARVKQPKQLYSYSYSHLSPVTSYLFSHSCSYYCAY